MRTGAAIFAALLASCAPETAWIEAPPTARAVLVAEGDLPIHAARVDDDWAVAFARSDAAEIAYFDTALVDMALDVGIVPPLEIGRPLPSPTAVFEKPAGADRWASREGLGTRLLNVRTPHATRGCQKFEAIRSPSRPSETFWIIEAGDDRLIAGDGADGMWLFGDPTAPTRLDVADVNGGALPMFRTAFHGTGARPFVFGGIDGTIWAGALIDTTVTVEKVAEADTKPITVMAGSSDPLDVHVLIGAGATFVDDVTWRRFRDGTWETLATIPQVHHEVYFDLEYIAADNVYATAWTDENGFFHFDGIEAKRERIPIAFAHVAHIPSVGTVAGAFDGLFRRADSGAWERLSSFTNELHVDEPPHRTAAYGTGLISVGRSYVVQYVDGAACEPNYVWPLRRFSRIAPLGRDVIIGSFGEATGTSTRLLRAVD